MVEDTVGMGTNLATVSIDYLAIRTTPLCTSCGDGVTNSRETCDGDDVGTATCADVGCLANSPVCDSTCSTIDYSACAMCCGDGVCDPGGDCDTCPDDCDEEVVVAVCGNGVCESGNGENCEDCADDCHSKTNGPPSGRYCCGTSASQYAVSCDEQPLCSDVDAECLDDPLPDYCCGNGTMEPGETAPICDGNF